MRCTSMPCQLCFPCDAAKEKILRRLFDIGHAGRVSGQNLLRLCRGHGLEPTDVPRCFVHVRRGQGFLTLLHLPGLLETHQLVLFLVTDGQGRHCIDASRRHFPELVNMLGQELAQGVRSPLNEPHHVRSCRGRIVRAWLRQYRRRRGGRSLCFRALRRAWDLRRCGLKFRIRLPLALRRICTDWRRSGARLGHRPKRCRRPGPCHAAG